jgi:hypothetical protein
MQDCNMAEPFDYNMLDLGYIDMFIMADAHLLHRTADIVRARKMYEFVDAITFRRQALLLFDVNDVYNNHDNGKSEHERRRWWNIRYWHAGLNFLCLTTLLATSSP